ncbi:unnamed protein product [Ilex paraguariensis]|uniref:Uncharacterized protein n=1 Tax=Ilex paraguariensis TaxID=185542 RepID=A0ABC8RBB6_9AQUA
MKAKWHDCESELTLGDDFSLLEMMNITLRPLKALSPLPHRETSTNVVVPSPTTKVHVKGMEIPTCVEDEDYYEDIRDVYGVNIFCNYSSNKVLYLSDQVKSSEEETRDLQEGLFLSKAQILSLEDENKSVPDRMRFL